MSALYRDGDVAPCSRTDGHACHDWTSVHGVLLYCEGVPPTACCLPRFKVGEVVIQRSTLVDGDDTSDPWSGGFGREQVGAQLRIGGVRYVGDNNSYRDAAHTRHWLTNTGVNLAWYDPIIPTFNTIDQVDAWLEETP